MQTMPGYELIGVEEKCEVDSIFDLGGGVLFRHGFENSRGNSYKTDDFEKMFAKKLGVSGALAVSSGTAALRIALAAFDIGEGDEVVTQAFTFVATAESIIESGATLVVCDIDETLNMCPDALESVITSRTKAIICVHMLGVPCRMEEIVQIARKHNLKVIEDTAWGLGASYSGRALGTWGDAGVFSFDHAKMITTGEGGMVVFTEYSRLEKARAWHDHGHHNNPSVPRWLDTRSGPGFNYRMSELQAAVGIAQLRKLDILLEAHRSTSHLIQNAITERFPITVRPSPNNSSESHDALVIKVEDNHVAVRIREELAKFGVSTKILPEALSWHFAGSWEHLWSSMKIMPSQTKEFETSRDLLNKCVALPIFANLPPSLVDNVSISFERVFSNGG